MRKEYTVEITIDVEARHPVEAAKEAYKLLFSPDAWPPVFDVYEFERYPEHSRHAVRVDLDHELDPNRGDLPVN